mgnify:CR=1 FL=1
MNINKNMSKEHMDNVLSIYRHLPYADKIDQGLYEALTKTMNDVASGDEPLENGVTLSTLQTIVLMLCESCVEYTEEQQYESVQESMK